MQSTNKTGKLNWLNAFGFILVFGIVYTTVKELPSLTSNLITVTFLYSLFLYIKAWSSQSVTYKRLLIASIFLVFINVSFRGIGDFNYYKKAVMYVTSLMLLIYSCNVHVCLKTVIFAIATNVLIGILYLTTYRQGFNVFEGELLLTLNFSNPNMAGLFVLNTLLYLLLPFTALHKPIRWLPTILLFVLLVPLCASINGILSLTGCRSAIMALIVFVGLVSIDYLFGQRMKLKKWMIALVAIAPFVFVFFYVNHASAVSFDVSFGVEDTGKTAMTRMKVWSPVVNDFLHYFAFGDYYRISNGTGMSQMHNTHLDVYASYGMLPLIIYIILLVKVLWQSYEYATTRFQRASIYAYIACMVIGTFEASSVSGSGGLFILTNGLILLANSKTNESPAG